MKKENDFENVCGVIMPISSIDNCTESHWSDVLKIITESIEEAGFKANLVSNADDVGIIHKRIIQNLYDNPVVVCDVSGKNPNVMFELGLRLAFDKPTIIVKDDRTTYSFDTAAIEHLDYPRDLRFSRIIEFKKKLSEKIKATYEKSTKDPSYTTFLKQFGEFTVAKIEKKEVSQEDFILEEIKSIKDYLAQMSKNSRQDILYQRINESRPFRFRPSSRIKSDIDICLKELTYIEQQDLLDVASKVPGVEMARISRKGPSQDLYLMLNLSPETSEEDILDSLKNSLGNKIESNNRRDLDRASDF